jgi:XTP/dITP diphosphohydrolase
VPCGGGKTFGEIDAVEKRTVSHRARAFAQLLVTCFAALPMAPADQSGQKS